MKYLFTLTLIALLALTGTAQKRDVPADDFSQLSFGVSGTLYLTQGSKNEVIVDCSDKVFDKLKIEQRNGRLIIGSKNSRGWDGIRSSELDVYITMKDIEDLSLSGSGEIIGQSRLKTEDLELAISGSGNMELEIESDEVESRISGSGNMELSGTADQLEARISGSGKVRGDNLEVRIMKASISGSGNCYITVSEEVTASISGSGNVYYNGNPNKVISNSSGSGKIKKM